MDSADYRIGLEALKLVFIEAGHRKVAKVAGRTRLRDRRVEAAGAIMIILLPLLMAGLLGVIAGQNWLGGQTGAAVGHSDAVRDELQIVLNRISGPDIDLGAGTGPAAAQAYRLETSRLDGSLGGLLRLVESDPVESGYARAMADHARAHYARVAASLVRPAAEQTPSAQRADAAERSAFMAALREDGWRIWDYEQKQIRAHAMHEEEANLTTWLLALLGALTLAVGASAALIWAGIRHRHRAMQELEVQREAAERANRAKSSFLALMSHELRTPMNGILGMAHVLASTALGKDQRQALDIILSSGDGLMRVLNDILDLSKIEADKIELERAPFQLAVMIETATTLWRAGAEEKGVRLVVEIAPDTPEWVAGDASRIRQILLNLLSNAVKFTARGQITVRVSADAPQGETQRVRISIVDTGAGIDETLAKRLFEPFVQEDASTTRRFGGSGLGLAICRRLARLMGGDLTFTSTLGLGSTFDLSLPLTLAACAPEAPAETPIAEIQNPGAVRILVADDNAANRMVAESLLGAMGIAADLVADGAQALEALRRSDFDLVLMDIHMPVIDGIAATQAIRRGEAGCPDIPVIALTADAMSGDRERFMAEGFDEHLAKPINPHAFVRLLARMIGEAPLQADVAENAARATVVSS